MSKCCAVCVPSMSMTRQVAAAADVVVLIVDAMVAAGPLTVSRTVAMHHLLAGLFFLYFSLFFFLRYVSLRVYFVLVHFLPCFCLLLML